MRTIFLFSFVFLSVAVTKAQLTCTILQNDTSICRNSSVVLTVDTTQISVTACNIGSLPIILQSGLVAFYPFCGNANDESGNGNHGTPMGATLTTDRFGVANSAYNFNGSQYIIGSANNYPTGTRTISLWFYATNIGVSNEGPTVIGYGGGNCGTSWFETIDNPGTPNNQQNTYQVQGHCNNESVVYDYGATHPNNAWHHWVITTSPGGTKFYIDGVLVVSDTTFINETFVQGKDFIFGGPVDVGGVGFYTDNNIYGLAGKLDDIFIYNRELSSSEIMLLYQSQSILWSTGSTSTSITVAPLQTTTYYVTVTDNITTCIDSVTITIPPVDTSLSVLDPTTICSNSGSVRLQAGIAATYQWLQNGSPIAGATARDYTATQSGTYRVVVTNNIGCTDTSRSVDINLHPQPVPGFTINDQTQCLIGNNFIFTNTSTISSGSISFLWDFGDGVTATSTNAVHNYASSGSFNVKLVVTSNNGCQDSLIINVNVFPNPSAAFTINNSNQCINGNNFVFTNTSILSSGTMTYNWNFGDGNSATSTNAIHTYAIAGIYPVTLIATSNNGCADTSIMNVTVAAKPTVSFTINSITQCITGNNFIFTNTSTISSGTMTFFWDFGDGATATSVHTNHSYAAIGVYDVKLVATSNNGCKDSLTQTVTVSTGPAASFTINTSAQCLSGNSFTFTNTSSIVGTMSYNWSFGDGGTATATNATHSYSSAGVFNVKLVAISSGGCSDSITQQVTVFAQPAIPMITANGPLSSCEGTNLILNTTAAPALQWYENAVIIPGATTNGLGVFQSGVYTVVSTNANSCSTSSAPAIVTINPLPNGTLQTPSQTYICQGSPLTLTASGAFSYQWYRNATLVPGATNSTYNATLAGIYTVEFISDAGCRRMSSNSITLSLISSPQTNFSYDLYCENIPVAFTNQTNTTASGPVNYNWTFGDGNNSTITNPIHVYATGAVYNVKLIATSQQCPLAKDSITKTITIEKPPIGIRYTTVNVIASTTVTLSARSLGVDYLWIPGTFLNDPTLQNPDVTPLQDQLHLIQITSASGCVIIDTQLVRVSKETEIYVPKGFSPNGDGRNDKLMPILAGINELKYFRVYNRWGQLLYETKNAGEGWDGTFRGVKQPMETYSWIAEGIDIYGKLIKRSGATLLLR